MVRITRSRNRIEEALSRRLQPQDQYLPPINRPILPDDLKIIKENKAQKIISTKSNKFFSFLKFSITLLVLITIVGMVAYGAYRGVVNFSNRQEIDQKSLITEVNNALTLIHRSILPDNEVPVVRRFTNTEPIANETLFRNATAGDLLILYSKAKRAIIYRQGDRSIIEDMALVD